MTAPDRPTREQVDADIASCDTPRAARLAAEVRALRAELEPHLMLAPQTCAAGVHADWAIDSEYSHACPWCQADQLRAALVARTPQPAEPAQCSSCDGTEWACYACQAPHEGWLYEAPRAPLPVVPDGDAPLNLPVLDHLHDLDAGGNCRDLQCGFNIDVENYR